MPTRECPGRAGAALHAGVYLGLTVTLALQLRVHDEGRKQTADGVRASGCVLFVSACLPAASACLRGPLQVITTDKCRCFARSSVLLVPGTLDVRTAEMPMPPPSGRAPARVLVRVRDLTDPLGKDRYCLATLLATCLGDKEGHVQWAETCDGMHGNSDVVLFSDLVFLDPVKLLPDGRLWRGVGAFHAYPALCRFFYSCVCVCVCVSDGFSH